MRYTDPRDSFIFKYAAKAYYVLVVVVTVGVAIFFISWLLK